MDPCTAFVIAIGIITVGVLIGMVLIARWLREGL